MALNFGYMQDLENSKMRKNDRILIIRPMEGKKVTDTFGLPDKDAFKGGQKVHAIMDENTCLWYLKYEHGIVPPVFKQRFTSYPKLHKFVKEYFAKRNLEIAEVID